jgi:hypothetical protein
MDLFRHYNNRQNADFFLRDIPTPPQWFSDDEKISGVSRAWVFCVHEESYSGLPSKWKILTQTFGKSPLFIVGCDR